jgi:hypothetical protein
MAILRPVQIVVACTYHLLGNHKTVQIRTPNDWNPCEVAG